MFTDVIQRWKRKNQILFSHESKSLQDLQKIMVQQEHRVLIIWALDCAKETVTQFEKKYPQEQRPRKALELCEAWAKGEIKMPTAKRAILDAHAAAKEVSSREYGALCHAVGQAGSVVHVKTHAMGLPFYELTAIVHKYGIDAFEKAAQEKINYYWQRLCYWQEHTDKTDRKWADFLSYTR